MKLPTIASGIDASGARFERLLLEAGIHAEADDVMQSQQFLRDTAILSANTPAQALQWYEWARKQPLSPTRSRFRSVTGYSIGVVGDKVTSLFMMKTP